VKLSPAILLTGATGLLGRFILRRLLQAGHEVAVIVRPGAAGAGAAGAGAAGAGAAGAGAAGAGAAGAGAAGAGAAVHGPQDQHQARNQLVRQRIEQVLQPFESHNLLPRPRTIAWDFAELLQSGQEPSIAPQDLEWLQSRKLIVIHCAASIRFQKDDVSGEPYRTNVAGTQNLLQVCQRLNVSAFHHVSTAYAGQHRSGDTVMEIPVHSPEQAGNDYERSKILAEQEVMQCPHIGAKTVHRPSIVIGDSQTGFTSTFHGFYAPLQIGWQYAKTFGFSEQAGQWFRQQLGLNPTDRKNLVTVDWVAEGIVMAVEQNSGKTDDGASVRVFHWTNPEPVACQVMQSAIVDSIERATQQARRARPTPADLEGADSPSPEQFREQMRVYESYFQSDPTFDRRRAAELANELICPPVDYDLLTRLSDWAIEANFGWPKPPLPPLPSQRIVAALRHFDWLKKPSASSIICVQMLGPGSPESLRFSIDENRCFQVMGDAECQEIWRVSLSVLADCVSGTTDLIHLINNGYWLIEGKSAGLGLDCPRNWINHIQKFLK
jgi:nucleoside-diphosphate-sugar epimerase